MSVSTITIHTNNHVRPLLQACELKLSELKEFDYLLENPETMTDEELQQAWMDSGANFIRYKGELYDLSEFVRIVPPGSQSVGFEHHDHNDHFNGWHGIRTDSYFSGLLVRLVGDSGESVIVGRYYC